MQLYVADPAVTTVDGRLNTEVRMVPAVPTTGFPAGWPIDSREGGVPDPATRGPSFIQIGTEGGFLPKPVVVPNQPVDWNLDPTNFDMGLVNKGTLILGTAERADVLADFSAYRGKTLILYNDSPAPFPALDKRYDYYTGGPDLTGTGGTPPTQPGYGPNTRTIMQIRVRDIAPTAPYDLATLQNVFAKNTTTGKRGVFEVSQDEIITPQAQYNSAYNKTFQAGPYMRIYETSKTFQTVSGATATIPFQPKTIHDEMGGTFDPEYGRMSAMLGLTMPNVELGANAFLMYSYASPPVDVIKNSVSGTPIGSLADGTRIWKSSHNGVETHTVHTHLVNVQIISRQPFSPVSYQGTPRFRGAPVPPAPEESGWKETVRMNPGEVTTVIMQFKLPIVPFAVPPSPRTGGNEYAWHCHILEPEEHDMMRPLIVL